MTIGTVSTYSILQNTLTNVTDVENKLNEAQVQLSSGNKSADFTGLGSETQQYLSADGILAKTNQYLQDNKVVNIRLTATDTALSNIITSINSLQSIFSQQLSGAANNASFAIQLNSAWNDITQQLNSTANGQYLFGGTKTNAPPVDANNFPTLTVSGTPDTNYYRGSQQDITVRPQDNTLIKYNVRADEPGFQKLFAALAMAKESIGATQANSSDSISKAEDLLQDGLQDIIGIRATVGATTAQIGDINTSLTSQQLYWKNVRSDIGNTDIVSVSTQLAINQGILQAAFQAFAKITSLRLGDYLK